MSSKLGTVGEKVGSALIYLHFIGFGPSFLYFNYCYAREHGFWSWLFFGEVIPSLKALVWEYFVVVALVASPSPYTEDSKHYDKSREASNIVAEFVADIHKENRLPTKEENAEVIEYLRRAYTEAQALRDEYLEAVHPQFKKHYRDEYQESLRLNLQAYDQEDGMAAIKAYRLQSQWFEWLHEHREELDFP